MPAARWLLLLPYAASMEECAFSEPQGGRSALTASSKHSRPICLAVCLFVCYRVTRPGPLAAPKTRSWTTSAPRVRVCCARPRRDTSGLTIAALNQYFPPISHWIVPLARVQEWTSAHWGERGGGGVFEWIDRGGTHRVFPIRHNQKQIFSN